jgi:hypothetical protein
MKELHSGCIDRCLESMTRSRSMLAFADSSNQRRCALGGVDHPRSARPSNVNCIYSDEAIAAFERTTFQPRRLRLGLDPRVSCLTSSGFFLWFLGYSDTAVTRADRAIAITTELDHPYSLAYACYHDGFLHLWRREPAVVADPYPAGSTGLSAQQVVIRAEVADRYASHRPIDSPPWAAGGRRSEHSVRRLRPSPAGRSADDTPARQAAHHQPGTVDPQAHRLGTAGWLLRRARPGKGAMISFPGTQVIRTWNRASPTAPPSRG